MSNTIPAVKNSTNIETYSLEQKKRIEEIDSARKASYVGLTALAALTAASYVFPIQITNVLQLGDPFVSKGLSLVLGGITIYMGYYICKTPDYSKPENINKYKEEALKEPLLNTFTKHQGCDVKSFNILDKESYNVKLNKELESFPSIEKMMNHIYTINSLGHGFFVPFDGKFEEGLKKQMQSHLQRVYKSLTWEEIIERGDFINAIEWELIPKDTIENNIEKYKEKLTQYKNTIPTLYPRLHQEIKNHKIA